MADHRLLDIALDHRCRGPPAVRKDLLTRQPNTQRPTYVGTLMMQRSSGVHVLGGVSGLDPCIHARHAHHAHIVTYSAPSVSCPACEDDP